MVVLGICGSSGSGKSSVCRILETLGAEILDCDQIYHQITSHPSPCLQAIEKEFGSDVVCGGRLDRNKLGEIVFLNREKMQTLNRLSHHFVKKELADSIDRFRSGKKKCCVIDAPLLLEAGLDSWCDHTICVTAETGLKLQRIMQRDGVTLEAAKRRLDFQISDEELRQKCEFCIDNNGDFETLQKECRRIAGMCGL